MLTLRLRPSSPGASCNQPAAIKSLRLRVNVEASIVIAAAKSPGRMGPRRCTLLSSEYCVVFSPALLSSASYNCDTRRTSWRSLKLVQPFGLISALLMEHELYLQSLQLQSKKDRR